MATNSRISNLVTYSDPKFLAIEAALGLPLALYADRNSAGWVVDRLVEVAQDVATDGQAAVDAFGQSKFGADIIDAAIRFFCQDNVVDVIQNPAAQDIPVPCGPSLAGTGCAKCGQPLQVGQLIVDRPIYKQGDLAYIELLHASCQDVPQPPTPERPSHGSPEDRGRADAYYGRGKAPHYYPDGTGCGPRVEAADMTPDQVAAYLKGYDSETDRKDWGEDWIDDDLVAW